MSSIGVRAREVMDPDAAPLNTKAVNGNGSVEE
jgi:hypothetical protein